jgi:hypothetical protein
MCHSDYGTWSSGERIGETVRGHRTIIALFPNKELRTEVMGGAGEGHCRMDGECADTIASVLEY